ncbi:Phage integrase [Pseudomonas aeruginosa]|nr:Phage integrase [Pseudomonas aeruginosa]
MEVSWSHGIPKETYLAGNTQNVNKISATDSRGPVLTILRRKAG